MVKKPSHGGNTHRLRHLRKAFARIVEGGAIRDPPVRSEDNDDPSFINGHQGGSAGAVDKILETSLPGAPGRDRGRREGREEEGGQDDGRRTRVLRPRRRTDPSGDFTEHELRHLLRVKGMGARARSKMDWALVLRARPRPPASRGEVAARGRRAARRRDPRAPARAPPRQRVGLCRTSPQGRKGIVTRARGEMRRHGTRGRNVVARARPWPRWRRRTSPVRGGGGRAAERQRLDTHDPGRRSRRASGVTDEGPCHRSGAAITLDHHAVNARAGPGRRGVRLAPPASCSKW